MPIDPANDGPGGEKPSEELPSIFVPDPNLPLPVEAVPQVLESQDPPVNHCGRL
jgi:hypothetical protein